MTTDLTPLTAVLMLAFVLAWPALLAAWRRGVNREASEAAGALEAFAAEARRATQCLEIDPALAARLARLCMPELGAFRLVPVLPNATPQLVSEAAARLALRLRRRIAFERKMLARTAPGRRRAAIAGALPSVVLLALLSTGAEFPLGALLLLAFAQGVGCWLQARIARVAP
jgi:Flp pilus assembly protein TadB